MSPLAILLAAGIPAIFLLIIYTLDLYASRSFRLVLGCFLWGAFGGLGLSYAFNTYVAVPVIFYYGLDLILLYVVFAPVAEEIFKSLVLLYVSRQPAFTYFVDGAIYGFASGIGFSITENFLYLNQNPRMGVALAVTRAFSTCLMHGTAAGLVGVAVGRVRFRRRSGKRLGLAGGLAAAAVLHALFNAITQMPRLSQTLKGILPIIIGFAGVGLIAYVINLGLKEQQQWLAETLDRKVGVSGAEVRAAQAYGTLDEMLEPITQQFPQKTEQVMALVLKQAQLGIKRKVHDKLDDAHQRSILSQEIAALQEEMEALRKAVGPYVMVYVRSVFPEGALNVWARLELLAAQGGPADLQRWATMLSGGESDPDQPQRSIFGNLQARQAQKDRSPSPPPE
jgi:RsiW-degrading membrane proteinase PrsW (M82 family)